MFVKFATPQGNVYVSPLHAAAVVPASGSDGRPVIGACIIVMNGGAMLPVAAAPDAAVKALKLPIPGPFEELNGEAHQ